MGSFLQINLLQKLNVQNRQTGRQGPETGLMAIPTLLLDCLFTLLIVSFVVQKLLRSIRSHLFIFAFIFNILRGGKLIEKEIRFMVPRGGDWGIGSWMKA